MSRSSEHWMASARGVVVRDAVLSRRACGTMSTTSEMAEVDGVISLRNSTWTEEPRLSSSIGFPMGDEIWSYSRSIAAASRYSSTYCVRMELDSATLPEPAAVTTWIDIA